MSSGLVLLVKLTYGPHEWVLTLKTPWGGHASLNKVHVLTLSVKNQYGPFQIAVSCPDVWFPIIFMFSPSSWAEKAAFGNPLQHKYVPVFWNMLLLHAIMCIWCTAGAIDMDLLRCKHNAVPLLQFLGGIRVYESMHAEAPASPSVLLTVCSLKGLHSLGWERGRKKERDFH